MASEVDDLPQMEDLELDDDLIDPLLDPN